MAFSLSKLFGNSASKTSDSTDAIIRDVENHPYGVSENNVLYAGLNELGGYFFFQTVIVGQLHIKCKTGATLTFLGDNFELQLDSDMPEFESENSSIKGRSITKIDFQIEESEVKKLENATLNSVKVKAKQQNLLFKKSTIVEVSEEEE
ncbi:hypothetical protein HNV10_06100 [Winogradskyella litoriviva]|uniref:Uncharacterized protein n=1 Tax=Winogradskyella litoriviva TaxID=1220182 RepID=A0ABX2E2U8_9FLAO|nr:hypothetical protein [Winogradskyella litoriviva]NRD22803.1 hypothetical protein [Winogradskyella litoriviva]